MTARFWWCVVLVMARPSSLTAAAPPLSSCNAAAPDILNLLPARVRDALLQASAMETAAPRDGDAAGRLGMLLHAYQQYDAADACYTRASQLAPETFAWHYLAGVTRAELSHYEAAIAALGRARQIDGTSVAARVRLADALMASGDPAASRAEYEALARAYPELALAHYGLGRAYAAVGNLRRAVEQYQAAVDSAAEFGAAHYALALAYRDTGRSDLSARHMELFRRLGPRKPPLPDPLMDEVRGMQATARELLARAARVAAAGRIDEAIALHQEALASDPDAAQAHVNLISLYARAGRPDLAEEHYREALRAGSGAADAHYNFGVLRASQQRSAEAAAAFARALDVDPFHPRAHNNLAALLAREGKRTEALEHYRAALANDPEYAAARFGLGRVLVDLGRAPEALEQFRKAEASARRQGQLELARTIQQQIAQMPIPRDSR